MMKIFKENGEYLVDTDELREISSGTYGTIYPYGEDKCLKKFKYVGYQQPDPIITIKNLSLANFYKIGDILYNEDFKYIGYISDFYRPDDFDILSDKEYLTCEVNNIYKSIDILTNNGYQVVDLHTGNVIVNKDGITIIDADNYQKTNIDNRELNMYRFKSMIRTLMYDYLVKNKVSDLMTAYNQLVRLLDMNSLNINHFNNVMKRYKKPIDYFTKVIK